MVIFDERSTRSDRFKAIGGRGGRLRRDETRGRCVALAARVDSQAGRIRPLGAKPTASMTGTRMLRSSSGDAARGEKSRGSESTRFFEPSEEPGSQAERRLNSTLSIPFMLPLTMREPLAASRARVRSTSDQRSSRECAGALLDSISDLSITSLGIVEFFRSRCESVARARKIGNARDRSFSIAV